MTWRRALLPVLIATAGVVGSAQSVFRSRVDLVTVDVSVRRGSRLVNDLTARDFEVRDNGDVQVLQDVIFEPARIETTLVVDLSGSVQGPLLRAVTQAVASVQARMRPTDRVNFVRFNQHIEEVALDASRAASLPSLMGEPGGMTSLLDALAAALIRPRDPDYRQLVIVFTDGADTMSFLDERTVKAVAARREAAVFVVGLTSGASDAFPHRPMFDEIAQATGGRVATVGRNGSLAAAFVQALDEFRSSYVLSYVYQGAVRAGWHDLSVRVLRPGTFDVRARRGYVVGPADAAMR